jgi:hypothetical protein
VAALRLSLLVPPSKSFGYRAMSTSIIDLFRCLIGREIINGAMSSLGYVWLCFSHTHLPWGSWKVASKVDLECRLKAGS